MTLDGWDVVLWLHLLAMATFVGGQLFLGLAVVPVFIRAGGSDSPAREWLLPIARRFGWLSLGALVILLATGTAMASHDSLWDSTALNVKLGLVGLAIGLTVVHVFGRRGESHILQALILLDSLAIVLVATTL
ncbi:MAG: hypothetical protein JHC95_21520 [Solirubrobacteraceae bacterium]|nr:hypothetical protein [Solirubrobacteraceae bacterium]